MSASERLRELDTKMTGGVWVIEDESDALHPDELAYLEDDAAPVAALRNALPEIVALAEAAERLYAEAATTAALWDEIDAALAALEEKLKQ